MPKQPFSRFLFLMGIFEVGYQVLESHSSIQLMTNSQRFPVLFLPFHTAGFLIGGLALLVMLRYSLPDPVRRLLALLGALPMAWLALITGAEGEYPGLLFFGTLAFATAAAPWLSSRRPEAQIAESRDAMDLICGFLFFTSGISMLAVPGAYELPPLAGLSPFMPWIGAYELLSGALLLLPLGPRWSFLPDLELRRLLGAVVAVVFGVRLAMNGAWTAAWLILSGAITLGIVSVRPRQASDSPAGEGPLDPMTGAEQVTETFSWLMVAATVISATLADPVDGGLIVVAGGLAITMSAYNISAYWLFPNFAQPRVRMTIHLLTLTLATVPVLFRPTTLLEPFMIVLIVPPVIAARAVGERLSYLLLGLGVGVLGLQEALFVRHHGDDGFAHVLIKMLLLGSVGLVSARNSYQQRTLALRLKTVQAELHASNEDLERAAAALARLAEYDTLTQLLNRRGFGQRMAAELEREGGQGAVAFLDLDQFKFINDRLGHQVGDMVLQKVAVMLAKQARDSDVVSRLGGDEFAMLMPGVDAREARERTNQLLQSLREARIAVQGEVLTISASIGVTLYPTQGTSAQELLVNADMAMYAAKESGRNAAHLFGHSDNENSPGDLYWDREIRAALDENRFVLYFQPIMDLRTGEITRHEALLRMVGRDGSIISPCRFLPSAERSPLIHRIDRWVVGEAIRVLSRHRTHPSWKLEVNLSGRAFEDPELLSFISALLRESRLRPCALTLEITETAAISDIALARAFISSLRELGCQFAIDDFGAGFSSLVYLKHLPVDYLKIDGEFIRELPARERDQHLVRAIAAMAGVLGVKTIAEWVSDAETVALLKQSGIDFAQGYWVGQPSPNLVIPNVAWVPRNHGR